jgi:hypothetical protein
MLNTGRGWLKQPGANHHPPGLRESGWDIESSSRL